MNQVAENQQKIPLEGPSKILIVDDEFICSHALCLMLKNMGYKTDSATNGKKAIEMILNRQTQHAQAGGNY